MYSGGRIVSPLAGSICQFCTIGGSTLEFNTNSSLISEAGQQVLKPFTNIPAVESPDMALSIFSVGKEQDIPFKIPASAKRLGPDLLLDGNDQLIYDFERSLIFVDLVKCTAIGFVVRPESLSEDLLSGVAIISLLRLLRTKGFYRVHAGAVAMDGLGVLLPGAANNGKTTTLINLVRSGFKFISDDKPLLRKNGKGLEILAFVDRVYATEATIRFFPELHFLLGQDHEFPKKSFLVDEVYPNSVIDKCEPRLLIFPEITPSDQSILTPVSKAESLRRLIPCSLEVVGPRQLARIQLQTLVRLIESTRPYLLHLGRDFDAVPDMIHRRLYQD